MIQTAPAVVEVLGPGGFVYGSHGQGLERETFRRLGAKSFLRRGSLTI